jgi:hypothetical protein
MTWELLQQLREEGDNYRGGGMEVWIVEMRIKIRSILVESDRLLK